MLGVCVNPTIFLNSHLVAKIFFPREKLTYNIRVSSPRSSARDIYLCLLRSTSVVDLIQRGWKERWRLMAIYSGTGRIWDWFQGKLKGLVRVPSVPGTMLGILYRLFSKSVCGVGIPAPSSLNNSRKMSPVGLKGPKKKKKKDNFPEPQKSVNPWFLTTKACPFPEICGGNIITKRNEDLYCIWE